MNTKPSTPHILYPKDEATLKAVAYYKYMTAYQIQRLVYPNAKNYRTATKRLSELASTFDYETNTFQTDGYLSYVYLDHKLTPRMGRPKRVFFLTAPNLRNIAEAYKRRAKWSAYKESFAEVAPIPRQNGFD